MKSYKQLWHNQTSSYHKELAATQEADVIVQSRHSLISVGTERRVITDIGLNPATAKRMAVPYMLGQFGSDFTYGYSLVGDVIVGSDDWVGKSVHLLHPHQELAFVDQSMLHEIPVGVDLKQATLASNLETAVNAVWDARPELGDQIVVVGYGLIGALVARLCQEMLGVKVHISETSKKRVALAKQHGFNICEMPSNQAFDMAFHTSGKDEGLQFAIEQVRREGKVIELSWYGSQKSTVVLGDSFHYDRKQIISSQVSNIPGRKQNDWDYKRRKELVFELLSKIDFGCLIERSVPFDQAPDFFNALRRESPSEIGIIIDYNE